MHAVIFKENTLSKFKDTPILEKKRKMTFTDMHVRNFNTS